MEVMLIMPEWFLWVISIVGIAQASNSATDLIIKYAEYKINKEIK